MSIHPTAIVDSHAKIAPNVVIGAYSIIGPDVVIEDECVIEAHVNITGPDRVALRNYS